MFLLQEGKTFYAGFKLGFVSYVYREGNYELTESHENPKAPGLGSMMDVTKRRSQENRLAYVAFTVTCETMSIFSMFS